MGSIKIPGNSNKGKITSVRTINLPSPTKESSFTTTIIQIPSPKKENSYKDKGKNIPSSSHKPTATTEL